MKLVVIVRGVALLAVAAAYLLVPAGSLPRFFPGFEAWSDHIHVKHGLGHWGGGSGGFRNCLVPRQGGVMDATVARMSSPQLIFRTV